MMLLGGFFISASPIVQAAVPRCEINGGNAGQAWRVTNGAAIGLHQNSTGTAVVTLNGAQIVLQPQALVTPGPNSAVTNGRRNVRRSVSGHSLHGWAVNNRLALVVSC
ncbi:MAG: hypothetical protein FWE07_03255 [Turicibacter sp.]|nr:hypothetical protein [Turicibacter sp.]